jgi:membrane protein DedA with SNARE-associated domain
VHEFLEFWKSQAYLLLFVAVLCDQGALWIPSQPALVAMGALIAAGTHSLALALPVAVMAAVLADSLWYTVGRSYGPVAIRRLGRRWPKLPSKLLKAQDFVVRREWMTFLASKFAPGPSFFVPLLAGAGRLPLWCFVVADTAVCAGWSSVFIAMGYFGARGIGL